ncbi:hypothetical protein PIB30_098144, partial [Stylosanthes scabra]|nr:hypothetical protein [Stylosanthes scabra]
WSSSVQTVNEGVRFRALMVLGIRFLTLILTSLCYHRHEAGSIGSANGTGFTFYPPYLEFRLRNSNSYVTRYTSENAFPRVIFGTRSIDARASFMVLDLDFMSFD